MGVADERIQVQVGADISQLQAGMAGAVAAVRDSASDIVTQFSGMASRVSGAVAAVAAAVAGGKAFADVVDTTKEWTGEAMKLARTLGITTEQASILNLALGDIYTSSETYLNAARMMQRQVNANGEGFKKLGVDIRDSNGHLRPTPELMQDVLEKINGLDTAQEKQAAGLMIFGRSWGEAQKLLKLNAQAMEEAKEKAERLHLVVGPEGVAALAAYKAAMNDAEDAVTAIKVRAGNELLPVLANLGQWFAEVAPPAIDAAVSALQAIGSVLSMTTVQVALAALAFKAALIPALIQAGTAVVAWVQTVQVQMHLASMAWRTGPAVSQFQALTSAVLGSINPWLLIGAAVLAAGIGLERWITSASRAAEAQRKLSQESVVNSQKFNSLTQEADRLDKKLNDSKSSVEQKKIAQSQLAVVITQLNSIYPGFNQYLKDEEGHQRKIADALKLAIAAKREDLEIDIAILKTKIQKAKAAAEERAEMAKPSKPAGAMDNSGRMFDFAFGWILKARASDANKAVKTLEQALDGLLGAKKALLDVPDLGGNHLGDDAPKLSPFDAISKAWEKQKATYIDQKADASKYGREAEMAFWEAKLSTLKQGGEDWAKATIKINDMRVQLDGEAQERRKAQLADDLQAAKEDSEKRLAIAQGYYEEMKEAHGTGSKLTIDAHKKLEEEQQRHAAKMKELAKLQADGILAARLGELDQDEEADRLRAQLGEISAREELARMQDLEQRRFTLKRDALQRDLSLEENDRIKRLQIKNQLEEDERQHQLRIKQIKDQARIEEAQKVDAFFLPMRQAMQTSVTDMLSGAQAFSQGMKGIWSGLWASFDQGIAKMATDWTMLQVRNLAIFVIHKAKEGAVHAMAERAKTGATSTGVLQRIAIETWGAIKSVALAVWTGLKWIAIQAYKAAAGAYSAIAGIPYVGPFLAPVMAGVALAAVIGMGSKIMSASGGYDIPAGVNPMVQAHAQEMILPANLSQGFRRIIADQSGGGGSQGSGDVHVHISAVDAKGVERLFMDNQGPLAKALKTMARNGRV